MAIGLVLLAGIMSFPLTLFAWLNGTVSSAAEALLFYSSVGWVIMLAGLLTAPVGWLHKPAPKQKPHHRAE
jgi:hypothetical protein